MKSVFCIHIISNFVGLQVLFVWNCRDLEEQKAGIWKASFREPQIDWTWPDLSSKDLQQPKKRSQQHHNSNKIMIHHFPTNPDMCIRYCQDVVKTRATTKNKSIHHQYILVEFTQCYLSIHLLIHVLIIIDSFIYTSIIHPSIHHPSINPSIHVLTQQYQNCDYIMFNIYSNEHTTTMYW